MGKFMNRIIKSSVIRAKYGKRAQQRYNKACVEYDCLGAIGIKGTNAWLVRETLKSRRSNKQSRATATANAIPKQPMTTSKRVFWTCCIGFVFWPSLFISIPMLIAHLHKKN